MVVNSSGACLSALPSVCAWMSEAIKMLRAVYVKNQEVSSRKKCLNQYLQYCYIHFVVLREEVPRFIHGCRYVRILIVGLWLETVTSDLVPHASLHSLDRAGICFILSCWAPNVPGTVNWNLSYQVWLFECGVMKSPVIFIPCSLARRSSSVRKAYNLVICESWLDLLFDRTVMRLDYPFRIDHAKSNVIQLLRQNESRLFGA